MDAVLTARRRRGWWIAAAILLLAALAGLDLYRLSAIARWNEQITAIEGAAAHVPAALGPDAPMEARFALARAAAQQGEVTHAVALYRDVAQARPDLAGAALFDAANALLREAERLAASSDRLAARPLLELAKETYREALQARRRPLGCTLQPRAHVADRPGGRRGRGRAAADAGRIGAGRHDHARLHPRAAMRRRSGRAVALRFALVIACASFMLAAWAPQLRLPAARFEGVIVLDITQSMNAEDYVVDGRPTSRLAAAKAAIRGTVEALPCGSRVGWGVFTEFRTLLLIAPIEVCANFSELASALDRIDGRMAWAGASEVAKGIHCALREAKALRGQPAIVFVTDGHEAPPVNPAYRPPFDGHPARSPV